MTLCATGGVVNELERTAMPIDLHSPTVLLIAAAVGLLLVISIVLTVQKGKRSSKVNLRERFGPEYDNALREHGNPRTAEARLLDRVKRVEGYKIRDLTPAERDRFAEQWEALQARFIDHTRGTVIEADELVNGVLQARGYPAAAFDQRAADISVHHAHLVTPYRTANSTATRVGKNEATTEELRAAMVHYRALFEDLLQLDPTVVAQRAAA